MKIILFLVVPNAVLLVLGLAAVTALQRLFGIKRGNFFFLLALSYLLGELVVVLFLNFSSMVLSSFSWNLLWGLTGAALLFLLWKAVRAKPKLSSLKAAGRRLLAPRFLIPVLLILVMTVPNIKVSFWEVLNQWDPRSIWFFHGKAFYFDNQIDPAFLLNPAYEGVHPNYPVFIPLMAAYHAHFLGSWNEILNKSFIYFHWLAALILLYFLWRSRAAPAFFAFCGVAFVQFVYSTYAVWGLGDSIWSLDLLLGMSFGFSFFEERDPSLRRLELLLGVLFLALAAYTKQEGFMGASLFLGVLILAALLTRKEKVRLLLSSALLFFLLALTWYGFVWYLGVKSAVPIHPFGFLRFDWPTIVKRTIIIFHLPFVSKLMIPQMFHFAVGVLLFAHLYLLWRIKKRREFLTSWMTLGTFWAIFVGYYLIYLGTPNSLEWQLVTSLERSLVVNVMLCLFVLVELARMPREAFDSAEAGSVYALA